jgi:GGDEF domain-containing protein
MSQERLINIQKKKMLFNLTKTFLLKLSEKYKSKWYENIFLGKDFDYLLNIDTATNSIDNFNNIIDNFTLKTVENVQKIELEANINSEYKQKLIENIISSYEDFIVLIEQIAKNEEIIIQNIEYFSKIEKEIDLKTGSLTKYWFDKEVKYIFDDLKENKYTEITVIVFDQNNLKNINETYWHNIWQESIWKFWSILTEELKLKKYNYILSNYYWWDEWFLILINVSKENSKRFIQKIFNNLKKWLFTIKNFDIEIWACAWMVYYKNSEFLEKDNIEIKKLIQIADFLVIKAKVQKNTTKSGNSFKFIDFIELSRKDFLILNKQIHLLPKKLKEETLAKKTLKELLDIRKKQNEKIIRARTLWVKKILRDNIELLTNNIHSKVIEHFSIILLNLKKETKGLLKISINKIQKDVLFLLKNYLKNLKIEKKEIKEILKQAILKKQLLKDINKKIKKIFDTNIEIFK